MLPAVFPAGNVQAAMTKARTAPLGADLVPGKDDGLARQRDQADPAPGRIGVDFDGSV